MTENAEPIWRFIPLQSYELPTQPAAARARSSLLDWARRVMPNLGAFNGDGNEQLDRPADELVDQVTPTLDHDELLEALSEALEESAAEGCPGRAIVMPPHAGLADVLEAWSQAHGYRTVAPPSVEQILTGDVRVLESLDALREPILIPDLQHWFIRDAGGLALMRSLIELLLMKRIRCVVGCESWSWTYLSRLAPLELLRPLVLAPLDAEKLDRWLARALPRDGNRLRLRQADNGRRILFSEDEDADIERSNFLEHLSSHAQGIPSIARACWRDSLRVTPDPKHKAEDAAEHRGRTLWVKPWKDLDWPTLPTPADKADTFVLHAILLHGGLAYELLPRVTGLPASDMAWSVEALARAGLIEERDGRLHTTTLGYPSVCRLLKTEGFLSALKHEAGA